MRQAYTIAHFQKTKFLSSEIDIFIHEFVSIYTSGYTLKLVGGLGMRQSHTILSTQIIKPRAVLVP